LEYPLLALFDGNRLLLASNDNWRDTQEAEIQQTAIVKGKGDTAGVALMEVYQLR